jgi:hypothetical protein
LEVWRHNIVDDELEPGVFDLVHTRAVLVHLAERDKALDHLVTALKPGGWLFLSGASHTMLYACAVHVSSSNFPRFGRNSNTGGDISTEPAGTYAPAINRVLHDATHASHVILPVIER